MMLAKYRELKAKLEEKKAKKAAFLAQLDEEYAGVQEDYDKFREQLEAWMKANNFTEHTDGTEGKIELRRSAAKFFIVKGMEDNLKKFLVERGYTDALDIRKQPVNDLKKGGHIPDELVYADTVEELAITLTKED